MTRWMLVMGIVAATTAADLLQSSELKRTRVRWWVLALAVASMAVSFASFLLLLSLENLTFAVPATAATYLLETLLARLLLEERIQPQRWAGALLVAGGVALLA